MNTAPLAHKRIKRAPKSNKVFLLFKVPLNPKHLGQVACPSILNSPPPPQWFWKVVSVAKLEPAPEDPPCYFGV